jgi:hypothetical protein
MPDHDPGHAMEIITCRTQRGDVASSSVVVHSK